ncbi:MAG: hypothetical protein M1840_007402 [Geoglossum simile]|nr:MAG: hypothetical protein M1840_007402 [Geoglossum simile]
MDSDGVVVDEERAPGGVGDEEAVKLYKDMVLISIMDLVMFEAQRQGRLSFYMVAAGEEGTIIGSASALTPDDVIFAQYREGGVLQQRGFGLDEFMANFFSSRKDLSKGRNMPNHFASRRLNVHPISSVLATQLPHAAGAAYALKMRRLADPNQPPAVAVCYFGEGAASEGDFHAALNIAATRSCPVIYICRNNGYAISTPTLEQYRGDGIASRGVGYGIETIRVDGNDIWAVREVTKEARRLALSNGGKPVLIEAMSYRVSHHSTSDDSFAYRARVEVDDWKRRDNPIIRMRKYLERRGIWDDEKEKDARESLKKDIMRAFKEAEEEKKPAIGELFRDIYEELTEEAIGQREELRGILERYGEEYDVEEFEGGKGGV